MHSIDFVKWKAHKLLLFDCSRFFHSMLCFGHRLQWLLIVYSWNILIYYFIYHCRLKWKIIILDHFVSLNFYITGLFKQQEFMKSTPTSPSTRAEMYVRQATPETYREVLKDIRQKEIYKLIIDTNSQYMSKFFRAVSFFLSTTILTAFRLLLKARASL